MKKFVVALLIVSRAAIAQDGGVVDEPKIDPPSVATKAARLYPIKGAEVDVGYGCWLRSDVCKDANKAVREVPDESGVSTAVFVAGLVIGALVGGGAVLLLK